MVRRILPVDTLGADRRILASQLLRSRAHQPAAGMDEGSRNGSASQRQRAQQRLLPKRSHRSDRFGCPERLDPVNLRLDLGVFADVD